MSHENFTKETYITEESEEFSVVRRRSSHGIFDTLYIILRPNPRSMLANALCIIHGTMLVMIFPTKFPMPEKF